MNLCTASFLRGDSSYCFIRRFWVLFVLSSRNRIAVTIHRSLGADHNWLATSHAARHRQLARITLFHSRL
jgi:hypothetical protein